MAVPDHTTLFSMLFLFLSVLPCVHCLLEAYGCQENWHSYNDHCYQIVLNEVTADAAKSQCESQGANLASVWLEQEKEFISSLWQFPVGQIGFLWIGLRGTSHGPWKYDDKSALHTKLADGRWSILDGVSGVPASPSDKCVALRPSGTVAFLDCTMTASASVCKKALPKVYVTGHLVNYTSTPTPAQPLNHEQLFERMFPPRLSIFPDENSRLAVTDVATEVGCAYNCFSITTCGVFQVSCHTHSKCSSFQCSLFTDTAIV